MILPLKCTGMNKTSRRELCCLTSDILRKILLPDSHVQTTILLVASPMSLRLLWRPPIETSMFMMSFFLYCYSCILSYIVCILLGIKLLLLLLLLVARHSRWLRQKSVVIGTGVEILKPASHLVGHDGTDQGV